jgi:transcriptional regulator with XRE-family HTH domain
MTEFGKLLRQFRHQCNDPNSPHGKLTQEKFAELVGAELGISYTGAAVSDWERGKSRIYADDRPVLRALIEVLYKNGGIRTLKEANQLLKAGNYRDLDASESEAIFHARIEEDRQQTVPETKTAQLSILSLLGNLFSIPEDEFQRLIASAAEGPSPSGPRLVVMFIRRFSDRFSVSQALKFFLWIWVWVFAWVLITPSLRWPFSSRESAFVAVVEYAASSILVPALIGGLINTKDNKFWQEQRFASDLTLRLYTHQGASIGFQLGYFFIFMFSLLRYNLGWTSVTWVELTAAACPLVLGWAGARLVPYNLFAAYKQLSLKDGRIFFVFFLMGPAWAYFLLETYAVLLTKALGISIVLLSITLLLAAMTLRFHQRGTTVIPVHWWLIFWSLILLCQLLLLVFR